MEKYLEIKGTIKETLPNTHFNVVLENNVEVICYIKGKMRMRYIKLLRGDEVLVRISRYDMNRGCIIYRYRKEQQLPPRKHH